MIGFLLEALDYVTSLITVAHDGGANTVAGSADEEISTTTYPKHMYVMPVREAIPKEPNGVEEQDIKTSVQPTTART